MLSPSSPPPLLRSARFLVQAVRAPRTVGAVAPSGRSLARALVAPVQERAGRPLTVLEVGAGTGAVTRHLVRLLGAADHLDVVEAQPAFLPPLLSLAAPAACRVEVHACLIEELSTDRRYDVIVSSLPLTNFPVPTVQAIMARYQQLMRPGATLTWFCYRGSLIGRALTSSRDETRRHAAVEAELARHGGSRRTVWANLPPASVVRVQTGGGPFG